MLTLTQIDQYLWTVTDDHDLSIEFIADHDIEAMSYVAMRFPARPCELNVRDYESGIAAILDDCCIAA